MDDADFFERRALPLPSIQMVKDQKHEARLLDEERVQATQSLLDRVEKLRARRERTNDSAVALRQILDKGGVGKNKAKAKQAWEAICKANEAEAEEIRQALADIAAARSATYKARSQQDIKRHALMQWIGQQAAALPLWVGNASDETTPVVGVGALASATDDRSVLGAGDAVAAMADDNWILAEITSVIQGRIIKYDVRDVDEQKMMLTMARRRLLPLPRWRADPVRFPHAVFPPGTFVLALYPQTTCFYKAIVHTSPATASDDYQVAFEDASFKSGFAPSLSVPQRYVIAFKDRDALLHRKKAQVEE